MRGLLAAAVLAAGFVAAGGAPAAGAIELEGTWYVLTHYQDSATSHPDAWHWDDRVWRFERKGDQLEWTEWPIVVLDDESGRFEPARGGRATRTLGAWEPSPAQLADIRNGVQVNSRGSKTKTLRTTDGGRTWGSESESGADSAMVITYSENWTITGLPDAPVFTHVDSMSGGAVEEMEGRTRYATKSVQGGGDELVGSFARDTSRRGRFRMIRSGSTESIRTAAKTDAELREKAGIRAVVSSEEMQQLVRDRIEDSLAESGVSLSEADLDALMAHAVQAMARGESPDEISAALSREAAARFFDFAKPGAVPDDSVRYRFPFDPSTPRQLAQGVGGDSVVGLMGDISMNRFSHKGAFRYAFDFRMPVGTPVLAARAGTVVRVVDHFTRGGPSKSLASRANIVIVLHDDGTFADYVHLSPNAAVKPGQRVAAGDRIGLSGNTGYTTGPHLHFDVQRVLADGERETVPIRFDDGSKQGVVPVTRSYYGGPGTAAKPAGQ
jgi:murein DD-endopeptidase MepM/ murein hydrolase activator NlpD